MSGASHIALSVLLIGSWTSWLEAPNERVAKGNEQFEAGVFDAALEHYQAAVGDTGDPAAVTFDEGAALYRLAEGETDPEKQAKLYADADQAFRRATEARNPELKSAAYYNLGNALYQVENWDEAVRAYKKALVANPQNDNARYNLELAQRQRHRNAPPPQQGQGQQGPPQPGQDGDDGDEPEDQDQGGQQDGDQGQEQSTEDGQGQTPESEGGEPQQPNDGQDQGQSGQQPEAQDQNGQGGDSEDQGDRNDGDQGDQGEGDQGDDPTKPNADGNNGEPGENDADAPSETDRKLDALERMSRDLRHQNLRGGPTEAGRGEPVKDW